MGYKRDTEPTERTPNNTSTGRHSPVPFGFQSSPQHPCAQSRGKPPTRECYGPTALPPSREVVERRDGHVGMDAKADISKIGTGDILGLEWVLLESLQLDHMSPLHPLRSKPLAQPTPFQTLELHSLHVPLQPCKMPKQLQGSLLRIPNHFYIGLDKAQSRRKEKLRRRPPFESPIVSRDPDPKPESHVSVLCAQDTGSSGKPLSAPSRPAWN